MAAVAAGGQHARHSRCNPGQIRIRSGWNQDHRPGTRHSRSRDMCSHRLFDQEATEGVAAEWEGAVTAKAIEAVQMASQAVVASAAGGTVATGEGKAAAAQEVAVLAKGGTAVAAMEEAVAKVEEAEAVAQAAVTAVVEASPENQLARRAGKRAVGATV
jgi:hypothetical protein